VPLRMYSHTVVSVVLKHH